MKNPSEPGNGVGAIHKRLPPPRDPIHLRGDCCPLSSPGDGRGRVRGLSDATSLRANPSSGRTMIYISQSMTAAGAYQDCPPPSPMLANLSPGNPREDGPGRGQV
jgi:hypothetical protein